MMQVNLELDIGMSVCWGTECLHLTC